jgi:hypothetical protein
MRFVTLYNMRSLVSIFLIVVMGALASGLLQWLHMREHERQDAREAAQAANHAAASNAALPPAPHHEHSEENCPVCAQLRAPLISASPATWLMDGGQWVRFVSMLAPSQKAQGFPTRLSCRGPPSQLS